MSVSNRNMKEMMFERFDNVLKDALLRTHKNSKIFYVHSGTGSSSYGGTRIASPCATIDQAVNLCTANQGDTIIVLPGHAETIASAGGVAMDVAGVTVIGVGHGDLRPTITFATSTAASITVSAADCKWMGAFIFKCNIASQAHMFDITADDFTIDGRNDDGEICIDFQEGSATGLFFVVADTADADSDYLKIRGCRFYAPTAGNYDAAIQLGKDFTGVRIEDCDIYGDFDNGAIEIPTNGDAQVDIAIRRCRVVNLLTGAEAIDIEGASNTGEIVDCRLGTNAIATAIDTGGLRLYNVQWTDTTDQSISQPVFVQPDSTANVLGVDDADNGFASTSVVANADGSVLERLEYLQANATSQVPSTFVPGLGYRVTKTEDVNVATGDDLFDVAGKVLITCMTGEVTNAIGAAVTDYKLRIKTDNIDLCAAGDISADAIGTLYSLTGDAADTLVTAAEGIKAVDHSDSGMGNRIVGLAGGTCTIQSNRTAGDASDAIVWTLFYLPLETSAAVTAAA